MPGIYATLTAMTAALEATGASTSTRLGLEATITGSDYPLIRVVPVKTGPRKGSSPRNLDVLVYFGGKIHDYEGLPAVYAKMCAMEEAIIAALGAGQGWKANHLETVFDEDRLPAYKMAAARFEVLVTPGS